MTVRKRFSVILTSVTAYLFMLILYLLRIQDTLRFPFLYAEDGNVLIEGSALSGFSMVISTANGTFWVLPKLITYLCYLFTTAIGRFDILPVLISVVTAAVAVLGIFYFYSDRFCVVLPSRIWRYIVCLMVLLLIPYDTGDVMTCNTSLPFLLLFPVFLIGLKAFSCEKTIVPTWGEAVFLAFMALSSAAAVVVAAIIVLAYAKKAYEEKAVSMQELPKPILVIIAAFIQVFAIARSTRVSTDLAIMKRIAGSIKNFVFFPWWYRQTSWKCFLAGLILIAILIYLSRLDKRIVIYCASFSFLFMLYCSFTAPAEEFFTQTLVVTSRYLLMSVMISAFMLGLITYELSQEAWFCEVLAGLIIIYSIRDMRLMFHIQMLGADRSEAFSLAADEFDADGTDIVVIPIPPQDYWEMRFPASVSDEYAMEDLVIDINDPVDGKVYGNASTTDGTTMEELFLYHDEVWYGAAFINASSNGSGAFVPYDPADPGFTLILPEGMSYDELIGAEWIGRTSDGIYHRN